MKQTLLITMLILSAASKEEKSKMINIDGDIILGGLFPMHESSMPGARNADGEEEGPCGAIKKEKGIQRVEAMLWSLDEINKDPHLLPGVKLGAMILDTCSSDTYALEQTMEFVRSSLSQQTCGKKKSDHISRRHRVVGVIGASFSVVSIMVANILRLFKIPQISYASTSTELSDKSRFGYFSRVVPPDNIQSRAMVDLVKRLNWKYVSTVAVEGDYGEKGIASFVKLAKENGICIARSEKIHRKVKTQHFDEIVRRLSGSGNQSVVVMFVDEDNIRKLLAASVRANKTKTFIWVGSDSWGAKIHPVKGQEWAAQGAITILPRRTALKDFDRYFKSLRPRFPGTDQCSQRNYMNEYLTRSRGQINCRNVWYREFWRSHFNCSLRPFKRERDDKRVCTGMENMTNYNQEGLVPFVVDAVYAMATALHNLIRDHCQMKVENCTQIHHGEILLHYVRNVSFRGRQKQLVEFNKDGDAYGSYNIYQFQKRGNKHVYEPIGEWKEKLNLHTERTIWRQNNQSIPDAICSTRCPMGYIRNYFDECCWNCVLCREEAIILNDTCDPCKEGWMPNMNKTVCVKLEAEYMNWNSTWAIVPIAFSSFGILCTFFILTVFLRYNDTPVIMASGRELCYVLLFGILLCYLMSFVVLTKPSIVSCALQRVGLGLTLCICYSAILTKTNRISRIFNRGGIKGTKRPSYISPRSQIVICSGICSIQLVGAIAWLIVERPSVREVYPYRHMAVLTCGISTTSSVMALIYNMWLIVFCTLYAVKTRRIPENFNEAKYIGFTMYSTCIVWLAFVPIYFGTNNDYKMQLASMCMCVSISATVIICCLFTPKVYIVLFQPYKNVRQPSTQLKFRPNHSYVSQPPPLTIHDSVSSLDASAQTNPTVLEYSKALDKVPHERLL